VPAAGLCAAAKPGFGDRDRDQRGRVFTHDLHSHVDSYADGSGGFARIKSIIDRFDKSRTLVLDAGDFSMGTLYQFGYTDYATELRLFGQMGYDATTFGNHEFDYGDDAAAEMLTTAFTSGDALPAFLYGNIDLTLDYAGDTAVLADTLSTYAQQTLLLEKNGVTVGIFALMGDDSIACAPTSGLTWLEQADYAAEMVSQLEAQGADLIVCISHGGTSTDPTSSEDELLAQAVDGIDLIISGHSHTRLDEPITVNGTTIASCGEYGQRVGTLTLAQNGDGTWSCSSYELVAVDSSVEPDEEIAAQIAEIKEDILNPYLQTLGFSDIDQVVAYNTEDYLDLNSMYAELAEQPLGNLIADAYIYGVQQAEGDDYVPVDVAVVPVGIVRYAFPAGDVTVGACFETCSLGYGTDGSPGYPLATVYLTGKELKALAEVDTSVSALMPAAQLYMTGLQYTYNPNRMFLNRVSEIQLVRADGSTEDLVDDQLYRVVGELYSTQMLGAVKASSYGLVSLEPKFADGTAVEDFWDCVVHDETGAEVKEWASLANYLLSLSENGDVTVLDETYHETQGRKVEDTSLSPVSLLKNANKFTYILLAAVVLVVLVIVLLVRAVMRLIRRGKRKKGAAS
jgi:2',3'-cyclic-nucleotide 2'-phosphodiesterase (5'-nucleotidase family)